MNMDKIQDSYLFNNTITLMIRKLTQSIYIHYIGPKMNNKYTISKQIDSLIGKNNN